MWSGDREAAVTERRLRFAATTPRLVIRRTRSDPRAPSYSPRGRHGLPANGAGRPVRPHRPSLVPPERRGAGRSTDTDSRAPDAASGQLTSPDGISRPSLPDRLHEVSISGATPVNACYVRVLATRLGTDNFGNPYLQLAEVAPQN